MLNTNTNTETETATATTAIYVACLSSYNAGRLHGAWIDCDQDAESIGEEIARMLVESPSPGAEEWAIHDQAGFPDGAIGELSTLEELVEIEEAIREHGAAYRAARTICDDHGEAMAMVTDCYHGEHESGATFAEHAAYEWGELSEHPPGAGSTLHRYIDFERVWRGEYDCAGWCAVHDGPIVHIFSPG